MAAPVAAPVRSSRLALIAAVASGSLIALQQRVNGDLGVQLGDALLAALVSFAGGLLLAGAVVAARPTARRALGLLPDVRWWERLGGLGGAALVLSGAVAAPEIGVALFTVGLVAGQVSAGVLVDRLGLGPGGPRPTTVWRVVGTVLCLVAVAVSVSGEGARAARPLLLVAVVLAGGLVSLQQALNGRVRTRTDDVGVATLVNFAVGTGALAVGYALQALVRGVDVADWPGPDQWELYLGGPIGVAFVALAAAVVRQLGVLRLGLAVISGQLVGAVLLDVVAPPTGAGLAAATVAGAALTLVAVLISGRR